jgi:hypothetical protein
MVPASSTPRQSRLNGSNNSRGRAGWRTVGLANGDVAWLARRCRVLAGGPEGRRNPHPTERCGPSTKCCVARLLRAPYVGRSFSIGAAARLASLCISLWMTCANTQRVCAQFGDNFGDNIGDFRAAMPVAVELPARTLSTTCVREKD